MPAGQAFIDSLANTAILYNDTLPRPFIVMMPLLRRLIAAEQAVLAAAGQTGRSDSGTMMLTPASGAAQVGVPTKIMIGADGPAAGGNGSNVALNRPGDSGHILIAAGGNATGAVGKTHHGGHGYCTGGGDGLIVALGGHGARTPDPNPLPGPGVDGVDGGDGGSALPQALLDGNSIYAEAGDGEPGSSGTAGRPGRFINVFGWFSFVLGGIPSGTDGDYGDGGYAIAIGKNNSDFFVTGGGAGGPITIAAMLPGGTPTVMGAGLGGGNAGKAGTAGRGLVMHGPIDVNVSVRNGDGTPGFSIMIP